MVVREMVDLAGFNPAFNYPYSLRLEDFAGAMQDIYDFFYDVNRLFEQRSLPRLEETLRPALMSGLISDMLTASVAKHSRGLVQNRYHNGHPDLIVGGVYANDSVKSGQQGIEIKTTRRKGAAVDTHGGRDQNMCVFVYEIDSTTQPAINRRATRFTAVYLSEVLAADFRRNPRGELGTPTSTLGREGIARFRQMWVYRPTS